MSGPAARGAAQSTVATSGTTSQSLTVTGVTGLPEITGGADLAALITGAAPVLADGDIVVVTSKIVSKAEGRVIRADREQAIDDETVRVVARRGPARIVAAVLCSSNISSGI